MCNVSKNHQRCNCKFHYLSFADGDCGRGFTRINDVCVNVSLTTSAKNEIDEKCSSMGENVKPLTTKSDSFFVQLKVGNLRIRVEE